MTEDLDTERAIQALVYRLRDRGDADIEVVAREFMLELRAHGWRLTEARAPLDFRKLPTGDGLPVSEETQRDVEEARRSFDEARARQRAIAAARPPQDAA
jgi:hypothetical protein